MKVGQSFGNCPQYIQKRRLIWKEEQTPSLTSGVVPTYEVKALIQSADTFFIASNYAGQGTDVSHRGGKPGFVKVEEDGSLVFPDFRGNNHFNTIGNLMLNPVAGLLFFNYHTGDVLYLTTRTEILWDGPAVEAFEGAQRLVRFKIVEWHLVKGSLPFSWDFQEFSPSLDATGQWSKTARKEYVVTRIEQESRSVKSFYLSPTDAGVPDFKPGQHLPIYLPVAAGQEPLVRTYSLSQAPGKADLRLTVKREENGLASRYLHDSVRVGEKILAQEPSGDFVLDPTTDRPIVLLSAGVGITPMVSMLEYLSAQRPASQVYFLHGARRGADHTLRSEVEALQRPGVGVHFRYSQPEPDDRYDSVGRIDREFLQSVLPFGNCDFYLCGPQGFLHSLYNDLKALGVPKEQIRFETFGSSIQLEAVEKRSVEFRSSHRVVTWEGGSLLELAEKNGIAAPFSCRSGACGACSQRVLSGKVEYLRKASFEALDGQALLCSTRPCAAESCDEPLVIDL